MIGGRRFVVQVSDLLVALFGDELRLFVRRVASDDLLSSLPGGSVSTLELALAFAEACEHRGALDDNFFRQLERERPGRSDEIQRVWIDLDRHNNLLSAGRVIGSCRIKSLLSLGGSSEVYLAEHETMHVPRVVKVLRQDLVRGPAGRVVKAHFLRESRVIAGINHPNVIRILDAGEDLGTVYLVLELLTGGSTATRARETGGMDWRTAAEIVVAALQGLQAAHDQGVIHRDVKPDNILLEGERVVLCDFGAARGTESTGSSHELQLGTQGFRAPELELQGVVPGPTVDIFGAAATLVALTRPTPFVAHLFYDERFAEQTVNLPHGMRNLLRRATRLHPEDRPASARAFAAELRTLLDAHATTMRGTINLHEGMPDSGTAPSPSSVGVVGDNFEHFTFDGYHGPMDASNATLHQCDLRTMVASSVTLRQAVLTNCYVSGPHLEGTDISGWICAGSPDLPSTIPHLDPSLLRPRLRRGHLGSVRQVRWSPHGRLLATGGWDGTTRLWLSHIGQEVVRWAHGGDQVAWSPEGDRIVLENRSGYVVVSTQTGRKLATFDSASPQACDWAPRGHSVATVLSEGNTCVVEVWDARNGRRDWSHRFPCSISLLRWSPDGSMIAVGGDNGHLSLIHTARRRIRVLRGSSEQHKEYVCSLAWEPTGLRLLSGNSEGEIQVWTAHDGALVFESSVEDWSRGVGWTQSGFVAASKTVGLRRWAADFSQGADEAVPFEVDCLDSRLDAVALGGANGEVAVWTECSGLSWMQHGDLERDRRVCATPDGTVVAFGGTGMPIRLWDPTRWAQTASVGPIWTRGVEQMAFDPTGRFLATACFDLSVTDLAMGEEVFHAENSGGRIYSMAWSPAGDAIVVSDQAIGVIWSITSGSEIATLIGHEEWIWSIAWSAMGGLIASGGDDNLLILWDSRDGHEVGRIREVQGRARSMQFHPSGTWLLVGADNVEVWEVSSRRRIVQAEVEGDSSVVAWAVDGDSFAVGSRQGYVYIYAHPSGREIATSRERLRCITALAWIADGLSVTDERGVILVIDPSNGHTRLRIEMDGHGALVARSDGRATLTGSLDRLELTFAARRSGTWAYRPGGLRSCFIVPSLKNAEPLATALQSAGLAGGVEWDGRAWRYHTEQVPDSPPSTQGPGILAAIADRIRNWRNRP